jgi:hypothetical protein
LALVVAVAAWAAGCSAQEITTDSPGSTRVEVSSTDPTGCADVIDVVVTIEKAGSYRFDVTVRSADTGWDKYADLWEIRAPDGRVVGERVLAHPHVDEQPFTRSQSGIGIPLGIGSVMVAARDTIAGFCGDVFEVKLP